MSFSPDYIRIGRRRVNKRKVMKRIYQLIAFLVMFLFLSGLIVVILTGQRFQ